MKYGFLILFLVLQARASQPTLMIVGEQKIIHHIKSVTVTNPKSLAVKPTNKGLLLIAKKAGFSSLKNSNQIAEIYILPSFAKDIRDELAPLFVENSKLSLSIKKQILTISGFVDDYTQWILLSQLQGRFKKQIHLDLTGDLNTLEKIKSVMETEFKEKAFSNVAVKIIDSKIHVLYRGEQKPKDYKNILSLAEKWGITLIEPSNFVELKPMIEIEITIAEVKRNFFRSLGLSLPGQYSATVIPSPDLTSAQNSFDALNIKINAQLTNKLAKIIANPRLLCRSGETAHFIAGGEIPIKLVGFKTTDVQWKKYGVLLDITPIADNNKQISSKLTTEISLLDEAHSIDGIPALLTNRVETHFDLSGEKTIALSGLIKNELGRGSSGTPLLSEIPILGELFKSRDYTENKTELLILVTPRVISPHESEKKISDFWSDFGKDSDD